jgi:hypothetical protein
MTEGRSQIIAPPPKPTISQPPRTGIPPHRDDCTIALVGATQLESKNF